MITIPPKTITPGDQFDQALDKLRTVHLALAPDSSGWQDDVALAAIWATIEGIICDLKPVREYIRMGGGND